LRPSTLRFPWSVHIMVDEKNSMIGNWELYGLNEAEMHYALADSHLEAAIVLATALIKGEYSKTFSHAKVILSLHHHAVELFLKYAISRAGEKVPTHHHIRDLSLRYSAAYCDTEFHFEPPFVAEYLGATPEQLQRDLTAEFESKNRNRVDQEMRYHTDRDGDIWPGAHGVEPESYAADLERLSNQIHALHALIESRMARRTLDAPPKSATRGSF